MQRIGLWLSLVAIVGCASANGVSTDGAGAERVEVVRAEGAELSTSRENCEYLGRTEIRTNLGDRTATAFSWDAHPKYSAYLEALKTKAARQGADSIVVQPPVKAEFANEGFFAASMFRCGAA